MADRLYETDFPEWTRQQAALLRQRSSGANALDWDRLAEEIEDMGRSEARACESHITSILLRFLKLSLVIDRQLERHWRREVAAFRIGLGKQLSPSLRSSLPAAMQSLYADAAKLFALEFEPEQLVSPAPEVFPWSFEDVLGRGQDWLPDDTRAV
jgi:hypothetical protein